MPDVEKFDIYKKKSVSDSMRYLSVLKFFFNSGLGDYWHCGHSWPIVPASVDSEDDCGEADGM
jgi:hypothetical protein